jgi:hypothetical protein
MSNTRWCISALIAVALASAAWGPCSSDEKTKLTDEEFLLAAQAAANSTVLTIGDMPAGWQVEVEEPDEDDEEEDTGEFTGECERFGQDEDIVWPGEVATADADSLNGPTHEINTDASVFRDADVADQALTKFFDLVERCRDQIIAEVERDLAPGATYSFTFIEDLDVGNTARGIRVEFADAETQGTVDFLYIRQGRMILWFAHGGDERNEEERDTYLALLLEKARKADESLPN